MKPTPHPKQAPNSPMFPSEVFSPVDMSFNIPENEIVTTHSVSLSIVLAEPLLFLRGFSSNEHQDRAPSMLRGSLIVRVQKATKVKSITLSFKGIAKTDWPEGIPPKKQEFLEQKELHSHVWPFFNASFPNSDFTSGANMVRFQKDNHRFGFGGEGSHNANQSNSSLSVLSSGDSRLRSSSLNSDLERPHLSSKKGHHRSPSHSSHHRSESMESTSAIKAFADRLLRAASPSPAPRLSSPSGPRYSAAGRSASSNATATARASQSPSRDSTFSHGLAPRRSFSKDEPLEPDTQTKGYRTFEAGEYFYNFELPIPQSLPETMDCNFGSVRYFLEAAIDKPGTFRTKVQGTKEVPIIRAPSDNNLEVSEPIAISKNWEDQLYYEIVISGKAFPIGTHIPIAFKLTPLAKVELHRIRVYITENCEYYCKNKRVHRVEPTKRFLLEELVSKEGLQGNLLYELVPSGVGPEDSLEGVSVEHELNSVIPTEFPMKKDLLHANSTFENIKVHHWIKIVLRLSKRTEETDATGKTKRKHYEISIDSPIHLLDTHCTNANVFLPAYIDPVSKRPGVNLHRPIPAGEFDSNGVPITNDFARPIHFLRKPSIAPPPFDADQPPPILDDLLRNSMNSQANANGASSVSRSSITNTAVSSSSTLSEDAASLSGASSTLNTAGARNSATSATSNAPEAPPPTYELAVSDNSRESYRDRFKEYQIMKERESSRDRGDDSAKPGHSRGRSLGGGTPTQSSLSMAHTASAPQETISTSTDAATSESNTYTTATATTTATTTTTRQNRSSTGSSSNSGDLNSDYSIYNIGVQSTNSNDPSETSSVQYSTNDTRSISDSSFVPTSLDRARMPSTVSSVDIVDQTDDDLYAVQPSLSVNVSTTHSSIPEEQDEIDPEDPLVPVLLASRPSNSESANGPTVSSPASVLGYGRQPGPGSLLYPSNDNGIASARPLSTNTSGLHRTGAIHSRAVSSSSHEIPDLSSSARSSSHDHLGTDTISTRNGNGRKSSGGSSDSSNNTQIPPEREHTKEIEGMVLKTKLGDSDMAVTDGSSHSTPSRPLPAGTNKSNSNASLFKDSFMSSPPGQGFAPSYLTMPKRANNNPGTTPMGATAPSDMEPNPQTYSPTFSFSGSTDDEVGEDDDYVSAALNRTYANDGAIAGHRPSITPLMMGQSTLNGSSLLSPNGGVYGIPGSANSVNNSSTFLEESMGIIGGGQLPVSNSGFSGFDGHRSGVITGSGAFERVGRLDSVGDIGLRTIGGFDGYGDTEDAGGDSRRRTLIASAVGATTTGVRRRQKQTQEQQSQEEVDEDELPIASNSSLWVS